MSANDYGAEYEGELQPLVDWVPPEDDATGDEEAEIEAADVALGVFEPEVTARGERELESVAERSRREEPEHEPVAKDHGQLVIDDESVEEDPSSATARFGSHLGLSPEERALHIEDTNETDG